MAITNVYVNPSIDGNSGAGSVGDPYGDLEYAISDQGSVANRRFCMIAGTAEVLTQPLSTTIGAVTGPSFSSPCIIEGCTATAQDGGFGEIDCDGGAGFSGNEDGLLLRNMKVGNCGSSNIWANSALNVQYEGVWFHTTTGKGLVLPNTVRSPVMRCRFSNIGSLGIDAEPAPRISVFGCLFQNGTNKFTKCIVGDSGTISESVIAFNVFDVDSSTICIEVDLANRIWFNSLYGGGGTGKGIRLENDNCSLMGNIIEGFSGAGAIGLELVSGEDLAHAFNNWFYDNTTNASLGTGDVYMSDGTNGVNTLTASGFTNAATGDFSPSDEVKLKTDWLGNFLQTSLASGLHAGACQAGGSGGGGLFRHPGMSGGFNG